MCGPKTAACCTILSTWGLVQLGITGLFMYLGSPALVEDIPLEENRLKTLTSIGSCFCVRFRAQTLLCKNICGDLGDTINGVYSVTNCDSQESRRSVSDDVGAVSE